MCRAACGPEGSVNHPSPNGRYRLDPDILIRMLATLAIIMLARRTIAASMLATVLRPLALRLQVALVALQLSVAAACTEVRSGMHEWILTR